MVDLICISAAWFAGGFINGVAGFGAAMVAMPLAAPFMEISLAVPACTLIVLTLNCQVGWTFRKDIRWKYVKKIFIGAIPGVILSSFALSYLSETHLKAGMGIFIAGYALVSLVSGKGEVRVIHPAWGYLSGLLSSALGMAFGFNGPPLAAYIAYCGCPARAIKGILGAGFIITGVLIVSAKALTGQINQMVIFTFVLSTPAVILGSRLGIQLSSRLNEKTYQKLLFLSLAAMGFRIAWSALM
ncbi:sulfite exporter TauE/SafE family protein [Desulfospira joergensenii]|uniref:sulfite exporter TauE/SafE family protein n=1 Tax=Desulfospira joergensenii TaxID=53329 RepID=UPI0003B58E29|nr:sulfite exporter TauE/SafE family protein [Desulfospira joergensenii]